MNSSIICGRLTKDPVVRYTAGDNPLAIARYTVAVDRRFKREGEQSADFIPCIAFGKAAEFADKYLRQGTKMLIRGHIQTGSYTNKDGQKVFTTELAVDEQEFAESKRQDNGGQTVAKPATASVRHDSFMDIPDGMDDDPFA